MTDLTEVDVVAFQSVDWMDDAYCRHGSGVDPGLFFPEQWDPNSSQEALVACARCQVKEECLEYAIGDLSIRGIWGGTSHRQRRDIHAERSRQGRSAR